MWVPLHDLLEIGGFEDLDPVHGPPSVASTGDKTNSGHDGPTVEIIVDNLRSSYGKLLASCRTTVPHLQCEYSPSGHPILLWLVVRLGDHRCG